MKSLKSVIIAFVFSLFGISCTKENYQIIELKNDSLELRAIGAPTVPPMTDYKPAMFNDNEVTEVELKAFIVQTEINA